MRRNTTPEPASTPSTSMPVSFLKASNTNRLRLESFDVYTMTFCAAAGSATRNAEQARSISRCSMAVSLRAKSRRTVYKRADKTTELVSEHCGRSFHACARRRRVAEIAQRAFEVVQVGQDVLRPDEAHGADADHAIVELGALARDHGAIVRIHVPYDGRALQPLGHDPDRHGRRKMPGREHRKPERHKARAQRRGETRVTAQHRWQALLLDHRERLAQSEDQRNGRRERRFVLVE